ncbi:MULTISPECIES: response regulator transcription factor [Paenibacillus]|uniref:response regulator transcription factor n=1 Tax=Paenibacillus TaxID=44249 RepID=UPI0022B8CE42|nr:response regulator [Paenibacillus caseinilyticus]MCZ8520986.1 response regulator [Paenibacillus caseinilyticus]
MRRMLIVDDEPLIADGLEAYFQKAAFDDLEIIKVYSATGAIDWLNIVKIDMVLSDICMPGMGGMELIGEIMDRWPRCKVILLTGHNEFDYAHQAIRNPCVVDYLLKTEGMDRIRSAVEDTLKRIAAEHDFHTQAQWFRDKLPKALPQLQRQLLWGIARRSGGRDLLSLQDEFEAVHLPYRAELGVLPLILRIEEWRNYESDSDRGLIRYAAANIAEELLGDKSEGKAFELDRQTVAIFLQPEAGLLNRVGREEGWTRTVRFVHGTMESVQQACGECLQLSVSVAASEGAVGWQELHGALSRLSLAAAGSPGLGMEKLVRVDVTSISTAPPRSQASHAMSEHLLDHLKAQLLQGQEDWAATFRRWAEAAGAEGPQDPYLKLRLLSGLGECLLQTLQELGLSPEDYAETDLSGMLRFDIHTRWPEVLSFYESAFRSLVTRRSDTYKSSEVQILSAIHHYIRGHLKDDLSLTRIAQEVSLNPSYLSRWYKKVTGKGLSDYILERKIERSKELLLGSSCKMYDISEEVGFSDQHYFFRFFKKAVGCTPQEFRDGRKG